MFFIFEDIYYIVNMIHTKSITNGISLPKEIWYTIDHNRGDVSRSKYILRMIEKNLPSKVSSFSKKVVA